MKGEDEENIRGENKKKVGTKDEENIGGEDEESIEVEDRIMTMIEELRTCGNGQKHSVIIPPYLILGYLGMNIAMGIVGLPELQDYWTREPLHVP